MNERNELLRHIHTRARSEAIFKMLIKASGEIKRDCRIIVDNDVLFISTDEAKKVLEMLFNKYLQNN